MKQPHYNLILAMSLAALAAASCGLVNTKRSQANLDVDAVAVVAYDCLSDRSWILHADASEGGPSVSMVCATIPKESLEKANAARALRNRATIPPRDPWGNEWRLIVRKPEGRATHGPWVFRLYSIGQNLTDEFSRGDDICSFPMNISEELVRGAVEPAQISTKGNEKAPRKETVSQ